MSEFYDPGMPPTAEAAGFDTTPAVVPAEVETAAPAPDAGPGAGEATTTAIGADPALPAEADPADALEAAVRLAEAMLFAAAEPVTPRALGQLLPDDMDAVTVLAALRSRYAGRGVELVDVAGGFQFRTAADLAPALRKVVVVPRRLPRVAMETLAIIAYHQPVTRPEVEEMRGASLSQQTLDALLEADLIAPKGRKEAPGRPTMWGTTPNFLAQFGLKDLRELPRREDLLVEPAAAPGTPQTLGPGQGEAPTAEAPDTARELAGDTADGSVSVPPESC